MNKERPNERDARQIIESTLGIELEHADKIGGVDYRSVDAQHAIEVTRVTDGRRRAARQALNDSRSAQRPSGELQTCWLVFAPDTQGGLKVFLQAVQPALLELESAGEAFFLDQAAVVHMIEGGPLSVPYRALLKAGVERASAAPNHGGPTHDHRIIPLLGSGGSSGGSDEALVILTDELNKRKDNVAKLEASGAAERHLFVWLDDDTRFDIARPLSREPPEWRQDGFGLPSQAPSLAEGITTLWVVHDGSRFGWLWRAGVWQLLADL